ncbi:MAG: cupin domain-containing protein [Steroidobacteraceae bacterium]
MSELRTIIDFSSSVPEKSDSQPAPERLLAGAPHQHIANFFSDRTGQFHCGTWESTPGRWRVKYSENEFCHVTQGRVRISDAYGRSKVFGPGASFVIPAGFEGDWEVLEPMKKLYVIFEASS